MVLEKYLILNKYFLSLFGVKEFKELQEKLRDTQVGVDSEGRTYFVNVLRSLEGLKIKENLLLKYDENIQNYVKKINYAREPVVLKYFQYLAVLFSEIFFDNIKNRKREFLEEINEFLKKYGEEEKIDIINELKFNEEDFKKIAFWMATGSGKTLIMHINYYQFFHYNLFSPDNIILITPNLGLSKQHYEELQKSGIPARLYSEGISGGREKEVLVIEITKFVEEKKGGGVTLPVETFEGKNLIFVDEGHKGKKLEEQKWARLRNELSREGFVLEYSATFGQILNKKNKETLKEYAKAIIFDYSYKYFYLDGYGKDFSILNIKNLSQIGKEEFQETMFIANLLSYYEQLLIYEKEKERIKDYNLEKPLWIFVGTTVISKKNKSKPTEEEKETISDVLQIVKFIKKVIEEENWLKENINKILNGETSLKNEDNEDIFKERFK
ncbi:MAG: DEAD/DEAH box helicase family protein, partial [candidate division WOR-3 bacterium]